MLDTRESTGKGKDVGRALALYALSSVRPAETDLES